MHPVVCPEAQRWSEAKDGDGVGLGEGGEKRRPRRGSHRQSKNQVSPQDELESGNSGLSSKRDSLVQNVSQTSPMVDECALSSRRGSHRQSRNQVSPQEEEFECSLNLKGGSGRQSRVFSPEREGGYLTGRGEEEVRFEREKTPKKDRRSGKGGGLCENTEEIGKSSCTNGYCEKVVRRCSQNDPLLLNLMLNSPKRPPDPSLLMLPPEVGDLEKLIGKRPDFGYSVHTNSPSTSEM